MIKPDVLTVKGAKFARKDEGVSLAVEGVNKDKDKLPFNPSLTDPNIRHIGGDLASYLSSASNRASDGKTTVHGLFTSSTPRVEETSNPTPLTAAAPSNASQQAAPLASSKLASVSSDSKQKRLSFESYSESDPYWKKPPSAPANAASGDLVVIHVCDESQQLTRDFCCHRQTLIENMRYFDRFLGESSENGYEDIDISVHCDVEIFEWLMQYIHETKYSTPLRIDKNILVSILISSDFLQMDELVELCVEQVAQNLNEIIRLPIDLSCLSDRLIHRIACLTPPQVLCGVRDKKDKLLSKLYKRRVELDFSRKASKDKIKSIASCLTCCRHCGILYPQTASSYLTCRSSPPALTARGELATSHSPLPHWSLTAYLKGLHGGGMGWEGIYFHVWAACVVLRGGSAGGITLLETDRFTIEPDGVTIHPNPLPNLPCLLKKEEGGAISGGVGSLTRSPSPGTTSGLMLASTEAPLPFCLGVDGGVRRGTEGSMLEGEKIRISYHVSPPSPQPPPHSTPYTATPSLHPLRPPELLTPEIYDLLSSNGGKTISGANNRSLLLSTMKGVVGEGTGVGNGIAAGLVSPVAWGVLQAVLGGEDGNTLEGGVGGLAARLRDEEAGGGEVRRGRSPAPRGLPLRLMSASLEPRRSSSVGAGGSGGLSKTRSSTLLSPPPSANTVTPPLPSTPSQDYDSDQDGVGVAVGGGGGKRVGSYAGGERRARSSSTPGGKRAGGLGGGGRPPPSRGRKEGGIASGSDGLGDNEGSGVDDQPPTVPPSPFLLQQWTVLRSLPSDLTPILTQTPLPLYQGVTLTSTHPLAFHPPLMDDMLAIAEMSGGNGRLEWELDIMREFDEKRLDRLERYLITLRSSNNTSDDKSIAPPVRGAGGKAVPGVGMSTKGSGGIGGGGKGGKVEYYKDRGRQAFKCVL
eukprot:gene29075-35089_t